MPKGTTLAVLPGCQTRLGLASLARLATTRRSCLSIWEQYLQPKSHLETKPFGEFWILGRRILGSLKQASLVSILQPTPYYRKLIVPSVQRTMSQILSNRYVITRILWSRIQKLKEFERFAHRRGAVVPISVICFTFANPKDLNRSRTRISISLTGIPNL